MDCWQIIRQASPPEKYGPGTWQPGVQKQNEHSLTSFAHGDRLFLQVDHPHFCAEPPHLVITVFPLSFSPTRSPLNALPPSG